MKAFLLCAGEGRRFYPHTLSLPKPLLPFLNIPLLSYNLYLLKKSGVGQTAVNMYKQVSLWEERLPPLLEKAGLPPPVFSREKKLLGSAGGLFQLQNFLEKEEHFFYLNGDSFILPEKPGGEFFGQKLYSSHIQSGALASFLVCPPGRGTREEAPSRKEGIWADPSTGEIHSFSSSLPPRSPSRKYDFSGMAVFSARIFQEIRPGDFHIFQDVLESPLLKPHLRVQAISGLELWDMNGLNSYLKGMKKALQFLREGNPFLEDILNIFSPGWDFFQGENYFSATRIKNSGGGKEDLLFCGKGVEGLEKLSYKNFAVLGDFSRIEKAFSMEQAVLGEKAFLNRDLKEQLYL